MSSLVGCCTNDASCFVANVRELVRVRKGEAFACWQCGKPLTPAEAPKRRRFSFGQSVPATAGVAALALGLAFGGALAAKPAMLAASAAVPTPAPVPLLAATSPAAVHALLAPGNAAAPAKAASATAPVDTDSEIGAAL